MTEASEMFKAATAKIDENLSEVVRSLKGEVRNDLPPFSEDESFFGEESPKFRVHQKERGATKDWQAQHINQEAHLVWEQLRWLFSLSENMLKLTSAMKWD